mmetsp:Transcript_15335/g.39089  ORF Transcript_15335/g.39089 Transcript_15335/m.39089 type:complete len:239 (+) Transcript_15335:4353-5069(+)
MGLHSPLLGRPVWNVPTDHQHTMLHWSLAAAPSSFDLRAIDRRRHHLVQHQEHEGRHAPERAHQESQQHHGAHGLFVLRICRRICEAVVFEDRPVREDLFVSHQLPCGVHDSGSVPPLHHARRWQHIPVHRLLPAHHGRGVSGRQQGSGRAGGERHAPFAHWGAHPRGGRAASRPGHHGRHGGQYVHGWQAQALVEHAKAGGGAVADRSARVPQKCCAVQSNAVPDPHKGCEGGEASS